MKNKIAFIHIPKTGGGSIKHWINKHDVDIIHSDAFDDAHLTLDEIEKRVGKVDWSFCCTRNTYAKMISFYEFSKEKFERNARIYENFTDKQFKTVPESKILILQNSKKVVNIINKGIIPFMEWAIETNHRGSLSQLDWVKNVDYICRTENIKDDFKVVQKKLNCDLTLGKTHRVLKYNPEIYYNKKFIDFIYENYKDEIEHFNYKPEYRK